MKSISSIAQTIVDNECGASTVYCIYSYQSIKFVITWENVHEGTGEIIPFYLSSDVICSNELLRKRIENAITLSESDDNADVDLYLLIRDTFDAGDCDQLQQQNRENVA